MAAIVYETPSSRAGAFRYADGSVARQFVCLYEPDRELAIAAVQAAAAVSWEGYERKDLTWQSLGGAPDLWEFTVRYGSAANRAVTGQLTPDQLSFKVSPGSVHITQSKQTLYRRAAGDPTPAPRGANLKTLGNSLQVQPDGYTIRPSDVGQSVVVTGGAGWTVGTYTITPLGGANDWWVLDRPPAPPNTGGGVWHLTGRGPDAQGAIGLSLDTVEGADVVVPVTEFTLTCRRDSVDLAFLRTVRGMVGKTNHAEWNGFPAGTLLYLGCEPTGPDGTLQDGVPVAWWNLAHSFRYEPDQANIRIGDIVVPSKGGHEYLWARYAPVVWDPAPGAPGGALPALPQQPAAVYVERVYDPADFALLGIDL